MYMTGTYSMNCKEITNVHGVSSAILFLKWMLHNTETEHLCRKDSHYYKCKGRQFLESWHSKADKNSINEKKEFPRVYKASVKQNA